MASLPTEILHVQRDFLFRHVQIRQCASLLNPAIPSPSTIVVYGPEDTGKTSVVSSILKGYGASYGLVDCSQCIDLRHLFTKAYSSSLAALGHSVDWEHTGKCDNLNDLTLRLKDLLRGREGNFYLVCDSIDKQREINSHFVAALVQLGHCITKLSLILVARSLRKLSLHAPGLPFIRFPIYGRDEAISIVMRKCPSSPTSNSSEELARRWYGLFVTVIYDSLIGPTTRSLRQLWESCERLWPRFIQPYVDGEKPPGRAKEWDFPKLLVRSRAMIQKEAELGSDEHLLRDTLSTKHKGKLVTDGDGINESTATDNSDAKASADVAKDLQEDAAITMTRTLVLSYFSALVLVAAYLASHTSPKLDILLFSRLSSSSRKVKKSYHRRKLFQSPTKGSGAGDNHIGTTVSNSVAVLHKNFRRNFSLDRLISIARAVHPQGIARRRALADKVTSELAELVRLRLVNLVVSDWGADERLTINVSREWVEEVAHRWSIDWKDFEV